MARVNVKTIRDRVILMNDGWAEGAPGARFGNIAQPDFNTEILAAAAQDQAIADLERQLVIEKDRRDDMYRALDNKSDLIANGVRGDVDYGPDSALYGAMGFIRKSERASGLTRKRNE